MIGIGAITSVVIIGEVVGKYIIVVVLGCDLLTAVQHEGTRGVSGMVR